MREHTMPRCPYVTMVTHPSAMHVGTRDYLGPDMSFRQRGMISFWNVRVGVLPRILAVRDRKLPYCVPMTGASTSGAPRPSAPASLHPNPPSGSPRSHARM